jgi:hypothetical protein
MPPALQVRQALSPSYSPVMHVLGRPLQYFLFSLIALWVTTLTIRMTHDKPDVRTLFQNSSYPIVIGIVFFNFLLSVFLCLYYLLNILFFGSHPTMTEHTVIVEKLFNFFSFKIVLVGMVIEPDIYDFSVWLAWYVILASMKAILQYGKLRLNIMVDANVATVRHYFRPFFHLIFGTFFVAIGFYFWKDSLTAPGHFGLSMLVLFDLVTLSIELIQSLIMYAACILKTDAERNGSISISVGNNTEQMLSESHRNQMDPSTLSSTTSTSTDRHIRNKIKSESTIIKTMKMIFNLFTTKKSTIHIKIRAWAQKIDYTEFQNTVESYSDILILLISLMHYFHVYTINGLQLSLVDIFLFLNIHSSGKSTYACDFSFIRFHLFIFIFIL